MKCGIGGKDTINRKCDHKRKNAVRVTKENGEKFACVCEGIAQEDGKPKLKFISTGAGSYVGSNGGGFVENKDREGGEKSISEEHIKIT